MSNPNEWKQDAWSGGASWDGRLDAESALALRAGVLRWVGAGRVQVSPAARLRRIRSAQKIVAPALRVWGPRQNSMHPASPRAWTLFGLAAGLAVAAVAAWPYVAWRDAKPIEAAQDPHETGSVPGQNHAPAGLPLRVATVQPGSQGLFARPQEGPNRTWRPVEAGETFLAHTLVQTALGSGTGELRLFNAHRVKLAPGTLVRLGGDPLHPWIDLWRGRLEVWAENGPLGIGTLGAADPVPQEKAPFVDERNGATSGAGGELLAGAFPRKELLALEPGGYAVIETDAGPAWTLELAGYTLQDEEGMEPLACRVTRPPPPQPAVRIQEGTANLLRVIPCNHAGQTVEEVVEALGDALEIRVRLSPKARQQAAGKAIVLALGQVTGAEALAALAEKAGLKLQIREGEVVLELPDEEAPKKEVVPEETF